MGDIPLPENERQIRPLSSLAPKMAEKAWKRAIEKAGKNQVTAKLVKEAVDELTGAKAQSISRHFKETWQLKIEPLLGEAIEALRRGDKERVEELLGKMSLLVQVGNFSFRESIE